MFICFYSLNNTLAFVLRKSARESFIVCFYLNYIFLVLFEKIMLKVPELGRVSAQVTLVKNTARIE